MVSEAAAKEIGGAHVDQTLGGAETGDRVSETTGYGLGSPYDVTVEVWRAPEERDDPAHYVVEVEEEGNIIASNWQR